MAYPEGHFASPLQHADTLIPQPGNLLAWDRYGYAYNNPVIYNDPSGHWVTIGSGIDEFDSLSSERTIADYKNELKKQFGLTISDGVNEWSFSDVVFTYIAYGNIARVTPNFYNYGNEITLKYSEPIEPGTYSGWTTDASITFYADSGKMVYQNVYHETAHAIDNVTGNAITGWMNSHSIYTLGGQLVFGLNGDYYERNTEGYLLDLIWDPHRNMVVAAQQHPLGVDSYGNTSDEDWADLYANYVSGNINLANNIGLTRYGFTKYFLGVYLDYKSRNGE